VEHLRRCALAVVPATGEGRCQLQFLKDTWKRQLSECLPLERLDPSQTLGGAACRPFEQWARRTGSPFELLAADAKCTIVGTSPLSKTYRSQFLDEVIGPFRARMARPLVPSTIVSRSWGSPCWSDANELLTGG
jgi:hypothetical protein